MDANHAKQQTNFDTFQYWLWTSLVQIERIRTEFNEILRQLRNFNPAFGYKKEHRRINAQLSADIHFLFISLNNLRKASRRSLPLHIKKHMLHSELTKDFEIIRNILDHWETSRAQFELNIPKAGSLQEYLEKYPNNTPWSISLDNRGFIIAGVVNVNELEKMLLKIEAYSANF